MFSDKEREEIDYNLKIIQLEFLKVGIKFMPWLSVGMAIVLIYEIFIKNCS